MLKSKRREGVPPAVYNKRRLLEKPIPDTNPPNSNESNMNANNVNHYSFNPYGHDINRCGLPNSPVPSTSRSVIPVPTEIIDRSDQSGSLRRQSESNDCNQHNINVETDHVNELGPFNWAIANTNRLSVEAILIEENRRDGNSGTIHANGFDPLDNGTDIFKQEPELFELGERDTNELNNFMDVAEIEEQVITGNQSNDTDTGRQENDSDDEEILFGVPDEDLPQPMHADQHYFIKKENDPISGNLAFIQKVSG